MNYSKISTFKTDFRIKYLMINKYNVASYGAGSKKLVIFAPISPQWNGIADIRETFERYAEKYSIDYVDTLSIIYNCKTINDAVLSFKNYVCKYYQNVEAIIGFAFGGTLLQHIVDVEFLKECKLIFISSPTYADNDLINKLEGVIALLQKNKLLEAINLVEMLVQPENVINVKMLSNIDFIKDKVQSRMRLLHGYKLMIRANASNKIKLINKDVLAIMGENSQLATANNVLLPNQQIKVIPKVGMRVFESNSELIYPILDELLLKESTYAKK